MVHKKMALNVKFVKKLGSCGSCGKIEILDAILTMSRKCGERKNTFVHRLSNESEVKACVRDVMEG